MTSYCLNKYLLIGNQVSSTKWCYFSFVVTISGQKLLMAVKWGFGYEAGVGRT